MTVKSAFLLTPYFATLYFNKKIQTYIFSSWKNIFLVNKGMRHKKFMHFVKILKLL
jgi:hypothetical protein